MINPMKCDLISCVLSGGYESGSRLGKRPWLTNGPKAAILLDIDTPCIPCINHESCKDSTHEQDFSRLCNLKRYHNIYHGS